MGVLFIKLRVFPCSLAETFYYECVWDFSHLFPEPIDMIEFFFFSLLIWRIIDRFLNMEAAFPIQYTFHILLEYDVQLFLYIDICGKGPLFQCSFPYPWELKFGYHRNHLRRLKESIPSTLLRTYMS